MISKIPLRGTITWRAGSSSSGLAILQIANRWPSVATERIS